MTADTAAFDLKWKALVTAARAEAVPPTGPARPPPSMTLPIQHRDTTSKRPPNRNTAASFLSPTQPRDKLAASRKRGRVSAAARLLPDTAGRRHSLASAGVAKKLFSPSDLASRRQSRPRPTSQHRSPSKAALQRVQRAIQQLPQVGRVGSVHNGKRLERFSDTLNARYSYLRAELSAARSLAEAMDPAARNAYRTLYSQYERVKTQRQQLVGGD